MGSNMQLGVGRKGAGNSTRLSFRQNKTHLTLPNAKGIFKSRSLLTQRSWSSICRVHGLAWNSTFVRGVCATPCTALGVWGASPAALPFAVLQPSLSAEHHHFFNIVFSLLFGTFILDYVSHYHLHTYHRILQTPECNRHEGE